MCLFLLKQIDVNWLDLIFGKYLLMVGKTFFGDLKNFKF